MNRIRWYGPTVALVVTLLIIMIAGPGLVRRLEWTRTDAQIELARQRNQDSPALTELSAAFRNVARVVQPSVVHIQVYRRNGTSAEAEMLQRLLPEDQRNQKQDPEMQKFNPLQPTANGSGWVYDQKGHIVTNFHVIQNAHKIVVRFGDGSERPASVVGTPDAKTDIGWGHQIRSYVLQPYQLVKDLRTGVDHTNPPDVLDGDLDRFMEAALAQRVTGEKVDIDDIE